MRKPTTVSLLAIVFLALAATAWPGDSRAQSVFFGLNASDTEGSALRKIGVVAAQPPCSRASDSVTLPFPSDFRSVPALFVTLKNLYEAAPLYPGIKPGAGTGKQFVAYSAVIGNLNATLVFSAITRMLLHVNLWAPDVNGMEESLARDFGPPRGIRKYPTAPNVALRCWTTGNDFILLDRDEQNARMIFASNILDHANRINSLAR